MTASVAAFVVAVAGGVGSSEAATPSPGAVVAWGSNQTGQTDVPVGLTGVTQIAGGAGHVLALRDDGTVVAWGRNVQGEARVPAGLTGVTQVAAGGGHSLAVKNDGTVVAWGSNAYGESSVPAGLTGVTRVAAGDEHSLAVKDDGTVVAWGRDDAGEATVPAGLTGVTQVAAGDCHSLALRDDGTVVAWGCNEYGQATVPAGLTGVTQVAAGRWFSLAVKDNGTVVAWGRNASGQTRVPAGLTGVTQVAAGGGHVVALKDDGTVVGWGRNASGQARVPAGLSGVTQVAAGNAFSLALAVDRAVVSFSKSEVIVAEGVGVAHLVVTGTNLTDAEASVHYARTAGTATPGVDFILKPGTLTFAPGQSEKQSIPVKIINDKRPERAETIMVTLSSTRRAIVIAPRVSMRLIIAANDERPDLLISTSWSTGYIGKHIYNTSGAGQTKTTIASRNTTRTFYVQVDNEYRAAVVASFRLAGRAPSALTAHYWHRVSVFVSGHFVWHWVDITRPMRSSAGWGLSVEGGGYVRIKMRITVRPSADIGATYSTRISGILAGNIARPDLVRARMHVVS